MRQADADQQSQNTYDFNSGVEGLEQAFARADLLRENSPLERTRDFLEGVLDDAGSSARLMGRRVRFHIFGLGFKHPG